MYGVRRLLYLLFAVTVAATFGFALAACGPDSWLGGTSYFHWTQCEPGVKPDPYHYLPDGGWDPCFGHEVPADDAYDVTDAAPPDAARSDAASSSAKDGGTDAGTSAQDPCPSEMCRERLAHWDGPWLLWAGPPEQAPECPVFGATGIAWEGYADLAPTECAPCECSASSGTCELSSVMTAHDVQCKALGDPHHDISFDAEAGWTGACDGAHTIPKSADVVSLSASAIKIHEDGCKVVSTTPRDRGALPAQWKTLALACAGSNWTPCEQSNAVCIKSFPEPFSLCLSHEGDVECPAWSTWRGKRTFYGGVDDRRECTECSCGPPKGSTCAASLSVYETTCGGTAVLGKVPISSVDDSCFDVLPPGLPLGSKTATAPVYTAGTCEALPSTPSGGTAEKTDPVTFCCEP